MIHKTKISVDERGKTAATNAITDEPVANFHANRPFIFFIVDRLSKLILLSGKYAVPILY